MSKIEKMSGFMTNNRNYVIKVLIDLTAIAILGIPVLLLFIIGTPYKRGFNCDDESIRYPYKDNTISSGLNYAYSTTIPIITITIIEFVTYFRNNKNEPKFRRNSQILSPTNKVGNKWQIVWQIYCRLVPFAFGALISQMTTDIAKYSIGRLRPHFIDVCNPRYGSKTFTLNNPTECDVNVRYLYITDFECTNTNYNEHRKRDTRLSFMSGHSSFAAYCLIYLVIYLQVRLKWSTIGFLRPLYQSLLIYLAIYTGFTRVSDYKHHWSDVLTGLIQGTIVAILTTYFISDLFVKSADNKADNGLKITPKTNYNSCNVEMEENTSNGS